MASDQTSEDKTLEPSDRKLEKAREEGRFPQSRDLSFVFALALAAAAVLLLGPYFWKATEHLVSGALEWDGRDDPLEHLKRWVSGPLLAFGLVVGGFLLVAGALGALAPLALTRLQPVFSPKFDLSRLDPVAGLGRMFSAQNLFALVKGVLVTLAVLAVGVAYFLLQRDSLLLAPTAAVQAAVVRMGGVLGGGLQWLMLVVVLIAIADASFQWFDFRRQMRMSLQDMKDENKESEGSPEIRARLRSLQREASRRRMMSAVEKADVVVVNPTHYAVALRYDRERMEAPVVVAKGSDEVALRIRELARSSGVPLAESPLLARWLSSNVELGAAVPPRLYAIVAQLLAWAYASQQGVAQALPDHLVHIEDSLAEAD